MLFAYVGPETVMPLTSVLAGVVGVVLLTWKSLIGAARKVTRFLAKAPDGPPPGRPETPAR